MHPPPFPEHLADDASSVETAATGSRVPDSAHSGDRGPSSPTPVLATPVGEQLRERLEALPEGSERLAASGEAIHAERALRAFYTERLFAPAWSDDNGARVDRVTTVRDLLELADVHGLSVADYHAEAIDALLEQAPEDPTAGWLADLDLLVTDSYLLLTSHLALGRLDPDYLDRMGFRVLRGWGADEREVDPTTVDWNRMGRNNMPFRFRQSPGPLNALGQVKFMSPNRFNVYLHDTPARNLFDRARRDFSSGCIRVENPMELTRVLLDNSSRWDRAAIDRIIDGKREQTVPLRRPVQTHMQYATTWVNDDGRVQFREDIYSRDEPVRAALAALPPHPVRAGR